MMTLNIPNLDRLISHLEGLPEEKFDMRGFYSRDKERLRSEPEVFALRGLVQHSCGTAACIAGWIFELNRDLKITGRAASRWLGLDDDEGAEVFMPVGWNFRPETYPLSRAIRTLKHMRSEYQRTGQVVVDWDAPEPVERKPWAAPVAQEKTLPAELTQLLGSPLATSEVL